MNYKKYFILIFVFLLGIQSIFAIGISPARTTLDFEPELSKEVSFEIINSQNKNFSVVFYVKGDLKDYIEIPVSYAEIKSGERTRKFIYKVTLPDFFEIPGEHKTEIIALEIPEKMYESPEDNTYIGATVGVATQLVVNVPYPGKYIDADVNIIGSGDKTIFLVPMVSRGKLDIVNARVIIDVFNLANEKIVSLESNSYSIKSLERKEAVLEWESSGVMSGKYYAKASIFYDNEVKYIEKYFELGELSVEILEVAVKDFKLGEIAKFNTLVQNKWSEEIKNSYLQILVYNHENQVMADFKSPTYNLPSMEKTEMVSYWDTAGVKAGTYDSKIILKYNEFSREREVKIKITENSLEVIGLTGRVVVKRDEGFNLNTILVIIIVILVLINVIWFLVVKRILNKKK